MRLHVTGYTAFGRFGVNPSALLAAELGHPFTLLPVTFDAVAEFLERREAQEADALLHLGVAGNSRIMRLEKRAVNWRGKHADVSGVCAEGPIEEDGPLERFSTLWRRGSLVRPGARYSNDAGDYLCNDLLYRSLGHFPEKRIAFLHVPPLEAMPLERQISLAREILHRTLD